VAGPGSTTVPAHIGLCRHTLATELPELRSTGGSLSWRKVVMATRRPCGQASLLHKPRPKLQHRKIFVRLVCHWADRQERARDRVTVPGPGLRLSRAVLASGDGGALCGYAEEPPRPTAVLPDTSGYVQVRVDVWPGSNWLERAGIVPATVPNDLPGRGVEPGNLVFSRLSGRQRASCLVTHKLEENPRRASDLRGRDASDGVVAARADQVDRRWAANARSCR
jgi:hypothetical protein